MAEQFSHNITQSYSSVFILDISKMSRLASIIEGRFKSIDKPFSASFEIATWNNKTFSAPKIESILEHNNTVKNPIIYYKMAYQNNGDEPANSCNITFSKRYKEIDISINSENPRWAHDLFAEIDEQIERTLDHSWVYSLKKRKGPEMFMFPILLASMLAMLLSLFLTTPEPNKTNFLTQADVEYLQKLHDGAANTDAKIEFLYQMHSRQLLDSKQAFTSFDRLSGLKNYVTLRALFILLPVLLILGCLFYLLKYCYPGSIFLWGDYIEYYKQIVERRRFVWNALVIALIIGILGNLFVFGMSPFI